MRRISISSIKGHKLATVLTAIIAALALASLIYYYSFIHKTPEECILNELVNQAEGKGVQESTVAKLKEADPERLAARFISDAKYTYKYYDDEKGDWRTYFEIGAILEYCNIDIEK